MASRLALSLARKHGADAMGRKVDNMEALVSASKEWLYKPGLGELLEEERRLRQEALDRLEELKRMREEEQRMREKEQRMREELVAVQRRVLRRLDPDLSCEAVATLDADEIATRIKLLLGDEDD